MHEKAAIHFACAAITLGTALYYWGHLLVSASMAAGFRHAA
jgi:hypothetical protein